MVAASRYLGRASLAAALRSFAAEGVWGTSPHLIPHFALHSPSGTISLALGLHGPNLGVGGGLHAAAEGFLAALTWLTAGVVPGVWLVLSGWSPELVPDGGGATSSPTPEASARRHRMPGPGPGAATRRDRERDAAAGPRFRVRIGRGAPTGPVAAPIDLVRLAERTGDAARDEIGPDGRDRSGRSGPGRTGRRVRQGRGAE